MQTVDWHAVGVLVEAAGLLLTVLTLVWRLAATARGLHAKLDGLSESSKRQEFQLTAVKRSMATLWHHVRSLENRVTAVELDAGIQPADRPDRPESRAAKP